MKCNSCGAELREGANFCASCGAQVTAMQNDGKKKKLTIAIIAVVVAVVLLVGGIFGGIAIFKSHDKASQKQYYNGSTMLFTDVNGEEIEDYYLEITDAKGKNVYEGHHTKDKPYVISLKKTGNYTFKVKKTKEDTAPINMEFYVVTEKEKDDIISVDVSEFSDKDSQEQEPLTEEGKKNLEVAQQYMYIDYGTRVVANYEVETEDAIYYSKAVNDNYKECAIYKIDKKSGKTTTVYSVNCRIYKMVVHGDDLIFARTKKDVYGDAAFYKIDLNNESAEPQLVCGEPKLVISEANEELDYAMIGDKLLYFTISDDYQMAVANCDINTGKGTFLHNWDYENYEISQSDINIYDINGEIKYESNGRTYNNWFENDDYVVLMLDSSDAPFIEFYFSPNKGYKYAIVNKHTGVTKVLNCDAENGRENEVLGVCSGKMLVNKFEPIPNSDGVIDHYEIVNLDDLEDINLFK